MRTKAQRRGRDFAHEIWDSLLDPHSMRRSLRSFYWETAEARITRRDEDLSFLLCTGTDTYYLGRPSWPREAEL